MTTATASHLGHLTPFVLAIARKRVEAGEALTQEVMVKCIRQAVDEDNARCGMVLGYGEGAGRLYPDQRRELVTALGRHIYDTIPKGEPKMNSRWVAFEKHLGRKPTSVEFLTSQRLIDKLMAVK